MKKMLVFAFLLSLFITSPLFALDSTLRAFQPKFIARYFSGPKMDTPAAYVFGTFPGSEELMVIRGEAGKLLLVGMKAPISEFAVGKSFSTNAYQFLAADPDAPVTDRWSPDDGYFYFTVTEAGQVSVLSHALSFQPVSGADWMTNFGNIEFLGRACPTGIKTVGTEPTGEVEDAAK